MRKFVLFTRGRTGSTAVMDSLSKADGIIALQEPFISFEGMRFARFPVGNASMRYYSDYLPGSRPSNPETRRFGQGILDMIGVPLYIGRLETLASHASPSAFGFKIISHHAKVHRNLISTLAARNYRCIYLSRNTVRQAISGVVAAARKEYNTSVQPSAKPKVRIDTEYIARLARWESAARDLDLQEISASGMPLAKVDYESFLSDRENFFQTIFDFLEIRSDPPPETDFKIMIDSLENHIENIDEVREKFKDLGPDI